MYDTVRIGSRDAGGADRRYTWDDRILTIRHSLGADYSAQLLDAERRPVLFPMQLDENELRISFPAPPEDGEVFECRMFTLDSVQDDDDDGVGRRYYSGSPENIRMFCRSLNISEDRLSTLKPAAVEKYQRLVDDAIDGYLSEFYFTPIAAYNQVQNDGSVRRVFPGKLRLLAIQWTSGLLMQSEFQNLEPNMNEQARAFVDDAKKEMQQITDFSMRIPGQRRKNPLPTMPPNLAPSKTAEYFL